MVGQLLVNQAAWIEVASYDDEALLGGCWGPLKLEPIVDFGVWQVSFRDSLRKTDHLQFRVQRPKDVDTQLSLHQFSKARRD